VKDAASQGKAEPRPSELDLLPIVVQNKFRNTADDRSANLKLLAYLRDRGTPQMLQFCFKKRHILNELIDDLWALEKVEETLAFASKGRYQIFVDAGNGQCVCDGLWPRWARVALVLNGVHIPSFCQAVLASLKNGRDETTPVPVLCGRAGGEGKSFIFSPLYAMFGAENLQLTTKGSNFSLLGLESKKACLLEEWDFKESTLPRSTQLTWMEGKPVIITTPQNEGGKAGHRLYQGSAPIFITTKGRHIQPLLEEAQAAELQDQPSEASMLLRRLRIFHFMKKITPDVRIKPCPKCFSSFIQDNV
jgi:hypothetical protein